ncbi:MAG: hypothetical protein LC775_11675 [Acidobacteria bacterium]|nr:hypothetical protein [Acidobacteriota bacterium]
MFNTPAPQHPNLRGLRRDYEQMDIGLRRRPHAGDPTTEVEAETMADAVDRRRFPSRLVRRG